MISLPTDNPLHHALASLGISAIPIAILIYDRPPYRPYQPDTTIELAAFVAGITIGTVLAGFSSTNRKLLITQKNTSLIQDLAKQKRMFDPLMSLFSWAIGASILLVIVSLLALITPFDKDNWLILWIPFVIFALSLFLRCEHTVSIVIKYILHEQSFRQKESQSEEPPSSH